MNKKIIFWGINMLLVLSFLVACNNDVNEKTTSSKPPTAQEVLRDDPDADIFQIKGIIYKTGIEWVNDVNVTKDKEIGIIKETSKSKFKDGTASKLSPNTKIFSTNEEYILIVEENGVVKKYLALSEG
ncbi:hypothetical protein NSA56_18350 [Oceanobacillus caeni]|uniref:Lipoprotein n=1 Tax=Oceanobacillus caeni TaxID=405946 RepID=A0ABR5MFF3_9BACI|nr:MULTISPECIES: hypothetical protein [Bacillaceae]PZD83112.1 hypothetical protein DEJ60_17760 [Bacilli bacterium]KPH70546.1 hypothetical protein AFL42_16680 [Oceanobacillus caeni]MCR1836275.1 hypothetical protein [Oceanobacillus caeni]MED4475374.1 hypothetical protein [Oceanobacillus caeni]PZD84441.1 hypothetical protein DEJ66_17725 [Bacilli bacterium]